MTRLSFESPGIKMQILGFFLHAILFRLVHTQTTSSPGTIDLVPDDANIDTDPSGVNTAINTATTNVPVRDPCGPHNQPNPIGNTCNDSIIEYPTPYPYGVQCLTDHTRTGIDFDACSNETIPAICDKLADPDVPNGTWVWASATAPHVCYMGFYLPPFAGSAQTPNRDKCVAQIFRPMVGYCNPATGDGAYEGMYSLGMVNVKVRPDQTQTGQAVDAGYPSYILASRQLTA